MSTGRKTETARSETSLAVEWHDCAWVPAIVVRGAPPAGCRRVTKPLPPSPPVLHTVRHNLILFKTMKSIAPSSHRPRAGFTLVELLVVIAIIGILAAMSMAVFPKVIEQARKKKAQIEMQQIITAIEKYDTDYGRFPVSAGVQAAAGAGDFTYGGSLFLSQVVPSVPAASLYTTNNSEVIAILMNLTDYPNGSGPTPNVNYQKNPHKTIFLNAPMVGDNTLPGVGTDLVYRDPWGSPYVISMDLNYDDQTEDAFYAQQQVSQQSAQSGFNGLVNSTDAGGNGNHFRFHGKVMVWSAGPNKKIDPTKPGNTDVNKDNVTSW